MREIIELCVELDTSAIDTYARLSEACPEQDVSQLFTQMGVDELTHVRWWSDLLDAWDSGLVPQLPDEAELYAHLQELAEDVRAALPRDLSGMDADDMLSAAAHLEFFMLDPAFAELIGLVRPTGELDAREAYTRHIMRLVSAIEKRHKPGDVAYFLARALSRALRDQQRLNTLATQDQLTELYNRRGFYGYVRQWTSYATRYGRAVSVIIVDVDKFKSINDRYGHPAGDEALRTIASAMRQAVRTSDIVGRYGGDEFAILAPETDKDELVLLMQRVLQAIRDTVPQLGGDLVPMTVSVGGAYAPDGASATPEQLLASADLSLYEAKDAGRDCAGPPRDATEL